MKLISLQEKYKFYKKIFEKTGKHPELDELLTLLLLPEKDKFEPVSIMIKEFYKHHKEQINQKIEQVMTDFNVTDAEILASTEIYAYKPNGEVDLEETKLWYVFADGIGTVQWATIHRPDWTPERIYNSFSTYWNRIHIPDQFVERFCTKKDVKKRMKKIKQNKF